MNCAYFHWYWPAGWFIFVLFIILVCGRFWWWGRWQHHSDWHEHASHEDPIEILKRRYAKGDISKEEFEQLKNDLRQKQ